MTKLTKRTIDSYPAAERDIVLWDDDLSSFGLRIKPSSSKSFIVQYRNSAGRSRRLTIGTYGTITPDQARKHARQVLARVGRGEDPAEEKAEARKAILFRDVADRYLTEHAEQKKKTRSAAEDRRLLEIVLPTFGNLPANAITRRDINKLQHKLRETPTQANRILSLLSKLFNLSESWGLRPDGSNPCRHVQRYKENKRERYLSPDELARLGETLSRIEKEGSELPAVTTAIRLLIFTGCRLSEILTLQWSGVDEEANLLRLQDSKTGKKLVHLGAPAKEVLEKAPRLEGNPYVCPGIRSGAHLIGLPKAWRRICKQADLQGVRIHDLRHSFASVAAGSGMGLPVIGALLGHKQAQTTARYAHLAADPLKRAVEEIDARIKMAMDRPVRQGTVVPIRQGNTGTTTVRKHAEAEGDR